MESTHSYTRQAPFSGLRALLKERIVRFVNQNPDVFEAICRSGAPFGGSCLPTSPHLSVRKPTDTPVRELAAIQQQLTVLTEQVAQLTNKLNNTQSITKTRADQTIHTASVKQIGINRFWALQASAHATV